MCQFAGARIVNSARWFSSGGFAPPPPAYSVNQNQYNVSIKQTMVANISHSCFFFLQMGGWGNQGGPPVYGGGAPVYGGYGGYGGGYGGY